MNTPQQAMFTTNREEPDIGASGTGKSFEFYDGGEWRWFDPLG